MAEVSATGQLKPLKPPVEDIKINFPYKNKRDDFNLFRLKLGTQSRM